jgi:2-keto-4-pentenoate hydratase
MLPQQLLAYNDSGRPWPESIAPFTDVAAAYQTALAVRALRIARGERPRGFKVGFTNRTLWERYRVFAPMWGTVWDTTLAECDGRGELAVGRLCEPRIEPEAVFGLKSAPARDADLDALVDAIDWVAPGFEIVQSHRPGWRFTAADTVADNGLHGRLLVGPKIAVASIARGADSLHALLAGATVVLRRDGASVEHGVGANVLDGPLAALHHFVAELRGCPGAPDLRPGDVVTTGTWTDAWPVAPGQTWTASFSPPLAPLTLELRE